MWDINKSMIKDIFGSGVFEDIYKVVKVNLFSSKGNYADALEIVKAVYDNAIMPTALCLMCIYFLIALVDKMTSENFTWEQMIRQFCMFLASYYLILHGFDILNYLFKVGLILIGDVYDAVQSHIGGKDQNFYSKDMIEDFEKRFGTGFIDNILMFCNLLLPWALQFILTICAKIVCYSRIIEIYGRATFAPLAYSDFFQNGFQGAGWRFLKSFLATCLQGALILVISVIFTALGPAIYNLSDGGNTLMGAVCVYLAFLASAVMLMFKSLSITREILGAN